jgi:small ligand-binding sensory domain FIST
MRFFESLCTEGHPKKAIEQFTKEAAKAFRERSPDLGFLFFSPHHADEVGPVVDAVREATNVRVLLGCSGETIIGAGREVERSPAFSLWLASLPGTDLRPFRVRPEQTPDGFCFPTEPANMYESFMSPGENPTVILVGEPFTMPVDAFLRRFNEDYPEIPVVGGMASGGAAPGENRLILDGEEVTDGAAGVLVSGSVRVRTVVSQGCRPIGRRYVVTQCDRNAILKMGGKPALKVVQELFAEVSGSEKELFQSAPHIGVVMDENQHDFGPGDFLIRNILGVDPAQGAIFTSDFLRRGQTVQFHVRDGRAASEDLDALLDRERRYCSGNHPGGGLIFSCNGRGTRLFTKPDHDISALRDSLGTIPVAGFFAQGEVGPVGDTNHLHGFTACVALFCAP